MNMGVAMLQSPAAGMAVRKVKRMNSIFMQIAMETLSGE
jgi:hypothetical protein